MGNFIAKSADGINSARPVLQGEFVFCADCSGCTRNKTARVTKHASVEKYQKWAKTLQSPRSGLTDKQRTVNLVEKLERQDSAHSKNLENPQRHPNHAPHLDSSRRLSLHFAGDLPDDWNAEQQERLECSVAEVARRCKLRPPGHREMKKSMMAHRRGDRAAACTYGTRSEKEGDLSV
jgi:hypothetical protein